MKILTWVLAPLGVYLISLLLFTMGRFSVTGQGVITIRLDYWYSFLAYVAIAWLQGAAVLLVISWIVSLFHKLEGE